MEKMLQIELESYLGYLTFWMMNYRLGLGECLPYIAYMCLILSIAWTNQNVNKIQTHITVFIYHPKCRIEFFIFGIFHQFLSTNFNEGFTYISCVGRLTLLTQIKLDTKYSSIQHVYQSTTCHAHV